MAPKYALVFWTKSKKTSVVIDSSFVKSFKESGEEIPICEGAVRAVTVGEKQIEAKILRICSSKKYLESLLVTQDGVILLHGAKPPAKELLAKKSNLSVEETEDLNTEKNVLRTVNGNAEEQPPKLHSSINRGSDCSHGCPSCCSGTLPPFPDLPDGFVSTLVSLAEYFQQFQKTTADKVTPQIHKDMSKNLNTWQWASREKIELKKGTGVWIDAITLDKILGHADMTKKPPHQTLVKSLLLDLLGNDKYIETTAEKIDRRLISAVVSFTNEKYPELAQPVERYYRCINLNRGYLQKRKNEGALDNEESHEGTVKIRRSDGIRNPRRQPAEEGHAETRRGRPRKSSGIIRDRHTPAESNILSNSDQLIIPLEYDNDGDFSSLTSSKVNNIIVVPSSGKTATHSGDTTKSSPYTSSQNSSSIKDVVCTRPSSSTAEVYDILSDDEDAPFNLEGHRVKVEEDYGYIEVCL